MSYIRPLRSCRGPSPELLDSKSGSCSTIRRQKPEVNGPDSFRLFYNPKVDRGAPRSRLGFGLRLRGDPSLSCPGAPPYCDRYHDDLYRLYGEPVFGSVLKSRIFRRGGVQSHPPEPSLGLLDQVPVRGQENSTLYDPFRSCGTRSQARKNVTPLTPDGTDDTLTYSFTHVFIKFHKSRRVYIKRLETKKPSPLSYSLSQLPSTL